jgi:hypothetical protein
MFRRILRSRGLLLLRVLLLRRAALSDGWISARIIVRRVLSERTRPRLPLLLLALRRRTRRIRRLPLLLHGRGTAHPSSPLTLDRRGRAPLLLGVRPDARRIRRRVSRPGHEPRRTAGPRLLRRIPRRALASGLMLLGGVARRGITALTSRLLGGVARWVLAAWGRHAELRQRIFLTLLVGVVSLEDGSPDLIDAAS